MNAWGKSLSSAVVTPDRIPPLLQAMRGASPEYSGALDGTTVVRFVGVVPAAACVKSAASDHLPVLWPRRDLRQRFCRYDQT
jgi:hypothetical protein